MNGAHKQSIEEQEKAKFSFSGATLYGINAVIGSGIFLLPKKIYSFIFLQGTLYISKIK